MRLLPLPISLLARRFFLALLRIPSSIVLKRAAIGQDRVEHMAAHGDAETDGHRNQLVLPPFWIVHGVFLGGESWL